jgi:hypothetical protein
MGIRTVWPLRWPKPGTTTAYRAEDRARRHARVHGTLKRALRRFATASRKSSSQISKPRKSAGVKKHLT